MDKSEALNELASALCKAQAEVEGAKKDANNPHYGKPYATLASVWTACREALTSNGLSVSQTFEPGPEGHMMLRTTLLHSSGQWLSGLCCMPLQKTDPQGYVAACTYARRAGLAAIVGVSPDDDDDGNAASGHSGYGNAYRDEPGRAESSGDRAAGTWKRPSGEAGVNLVCSGCEKVLTRGQHDVSVRAYGQPLCPQCQKAALRTDG